jgi:hypothetical protein
MDRPDVVVPANTGAAAEAAVIDSSSPWPVCALAVCNTQAKQAQRKKNEHGGFRNTGLLLRLPGSVIVDTTIRLVVNNELVGFIQSGQQQTVQQIPAIKRLQQTIFPFQQTICLFFVQFPDFSHIFQFGDFFLVLVQLTDATLAIGSAGSTRTFGEPSFQILSTGGGRWMIGTVRFPLPARTTCPGEAAGR